MCVHNFAIKLFLVGNISVICCAISVYANHAKFTLIIQFHVVVESKNFSLHFNVELNSQIVKKHVVELWSVDMNVCLDVIKNVHLAIPK